MVAEPGEDIRSRIWAFVDTFFILCSIILFIAETEPYFKERIADKTSTWYYVFFWGDAGCVMFFSADFLIRLVVWPGKLSFIKSVLNWLDFLAILPFFIMIITEYMIGADPNASDTTDGSKGQFVALKVRNIIEIPFLSPIIWLWLFDSTTMDKDQSFVQPKQPWSWTLPLYGVEEAHLEQCWLILRIYCSISLPRTITMTKPRKYRIKSNLIIGQCLCFDILDYMWVPYSYLRHHGI